MINIESWKPTNIITDRSGEWRPNQEHIAPWSRHATELECSAYVDVLRRSVHGNLLDVGAGTLPYYGIYKDLVSSVTATDWSTSIHDISHIDVVADANQSLPFADETFDTVLLADVLEHLYEPQRVFNDVHRVLRDNGTLVVFVPFMYGLHETPHDYYRYTKFALESLCHKTGLAVEEIEAYGGGPDVIIDLLEKMSHENRMARAVTNTARHVLIRTGIYRRAQETHKDRFPVGYTLIARKLFSITCPPPIKLNTLSR